MIPTTATHRWRETGNNPPDGLQSETSYVRDAEGTEGVLKVVRLGGRSDAEKRFAREVALLQELRHPNVAEILDHDLDSQPPWLVSRRGRPLKEYWNNYIGTTPKPKPSDRFERAHSIIEDLLDGLAEVHARGIVHRDIKPGNVILVQERAVLIDFGIAYDPDKERLTDEACRFPPQTTFAAPPGARYGDERDPTCAWDCLGVAWLWGWLLAEVRPLHERFHWRFHKFIGDPRCSAVKAILALCSHEDTVPTNAGELAALARKFVHREPTSTGPANLTHAVDRARQKEVEDKLAQAHLLDRLESALPEAVPLFARLSEHLNSLAHQCQQESLDASCSPRPVEHEIRRAFKQRDTHATICTSHFGEPSHRLKIYVRAQIEPAGKPISLVLDFKGRHRVYRLTADGTLEGEQGRTSESELTAMLTRMVEDHLST